jgi:uncharacterized protein YjaG (DUF416 family)
MAVNPLTSVTIATILLADRLSAGGVPLMKKALACMVAVFLATWLTQGMAVVPEVSQRTMYATLPLIAVYSLALSVLTDSKASITTVAMLEMTQEGREMTDEELRANPAVEQEWDIQWEIFRLLAECEERDIELIKGLRADLREAGESNIGININQ